MSRTKSLAKVVLGSLFGLSLVLAGGCGGSDTPTEAQKDYAANQNQSRASAYGKGGVAAAGAPGSANRQAGARRGGR